MNMQTIEELKAQMEEYNANPRVIEWRSARAEEQRKAKENAWRMFQKEQQDFEERVKAFNESHRQDSDA